MAARSNGISIQSPTEPRGSLPFTSHTFALSQSSFQIQKLNVSDSATSDPPPASPLLSPIATRTLETAVKQEPATTWKRSFDDSQANDGPAQVGADSASCEREAQRGVESSQRHELDSMGSSPQVATESFHGSRQTGALFQKPHKRTKSEQFEPETSRPLFPSPASLNGASPPSSRNYPGPGLITIGDPLTPAASSSHSDDDPRAVPPQVRRTSTSTDIRRLSVNSLLSGPPGPVYPRAESATSAATPLTLPPPFEYEASWADAATLYGYDLGQKDLDLGKNDDANAIEWTPPGSRELTATPRSSHGDAQPSEFGFRVQSSVTEPGAGGYYDKPVQIRIPKNLEPLPPK